MCGGIATHYASWRHAQWAMFVMGLFAYLPVYLWMPETLDPEILNRGKERSRWLTFLNINPFSSLSVLRSPNILILVGIHVITTTGSDD